jgi:hypothetical protein
MAVILPEGHRLIIAQKNEQPQSPSHKVHLDKSNDMHIITPNT